MSYLHRLHFVIAVVLLLLILFAVSGCFTPTEVFTPNSNKPAVTIAVKSQDPNRRTTIAISPDSKLIAVSRANAGSIKLWDLVKSQIICKMDPKFYPHRIGFTSNGVPFCGGDGRIVYWDKKTGER